MLYIFYFTIFIVGAALGSFLNVLISRSIEGKDWVKGRSSCDLCKKTLSWYDMIPLFSYLIYGGKSRCCHKKLSIQHPIVETLTGALFLWWVIMGTYFFHLVTQPLTYIQPSFWLLIGVILMVIFVSDSFYQLIPSYAVYIGVVATILYRILLVGYGEYRVIDLGISLISAVMATLFFQLLRVVTKKKGMGEGDVILAFLMGLLLSYPRTLVGVWLAFVSGGIYGMLLIILGKKRIGMTLPFGPFMVLGTIVALVWGSELWRMWLP